MNFTLALFCDFTVLVLAFAVLKAFLHEPIQPSSVLSKFWVTFFFQVEDELRNICKEILDLIDNHLIPSAKAEESKVFYFKM